MSQLLCAKSGSGQDKDPRRDIFTQLTPVVYASSPARFYEEDSASTAHCLDMLCSGLRDQRVLDLGCGYGTTTMALSRFGPREIVAVDPSADMLDLMRCVHGSEETNFVAWMEAQGARPVLGSLFDQTVAKFEHRRREFVHGIFRRRGGHLILRQQSAFELDSAELGVFDAVAANNVLHWPINQRRAELRKQNPDDDNDELRIQAIVETLAAVSRMLRPGGAAVLMEPKNFMTVDDDLAFDADGEAHTIVAHPLFVRCNALLNERLQQRYGIKRPIPFHTTLFQRSRIKEWCQEVGLEMVGVKHREIAGAGDIMPTIQATMPMSLGEIELSHQEKLTLVAEVLAEMERTASTEEKFLPLFTQCFFICCRKS